MASQSQLTYAVAPQNIQYVPPILGQLLDLISLAKINISEPRFEFYDPWDMATSTASNNNPKMKDRTFFKRFAKMR